MRLMRSDGGGAMNKEGEGLRPARSHAATGSAAIRTGRDGGATRARRRPAMRGRGFWSAFEKTGSLCPRKRGEHPVSWNKREVVGVRCKGEKTKKQGVGD